jgi:hypothetical protein
MTNKPLKVPIGFTRSCWSCKRFKNAWGGRLDRAKKLWHCADCVSTKPTHHQKVAAKLKKEEASIQWRSGKPPAVGWYRAKGKDFTWTGTYRWWDGARWSWGAFEHESAERAGRWAMKKESNGYVNLLMWSDMP